VGKSADVHNAGFFPARHDDLFVVLPVGPAAAARTYRRRSTNYLTATASISGSHSRKSINGANLQPETANENLSGRGKHSIFLSFS
jgi:hypothetical protein